MISLMVDPISIKVKFALNMKMDRDLDRFLWVDLGGMFV